MILCRLSGKTGIRSHRHHPDSRRARELYRQLSPKDRAAFRRLMDSEDPPRRLPHTDRCRRRALDALAAARVLLNCSCLNSTLQTWSPELDLSGAPWKGLQALDNQEAPVRASDFSFNWFSAISRNQASAIRGYIVKFEDRALRSVRTRCPN